MACYKKFIILLLIIFILLFNFSSVLAYDEESISLEFVNGLRITQDSNYFSSSSGGSVSYFMAEPGYTYNITTTATTTRLVVTSSDVPALNGIYDIMYVMDNLPSDSTYSFIVNTPTYIGLNGATSLYTVNRVKLEGMNSSIENLVNNVGPNALWGVFGSGIDFIFVVVIVAFGIFIIYKLITGVSKGKSKF